MFELGPPDMKSLFTIAALGLLSTFASSAITSASTYSEFYQYHYYSHTGVDFPILNSVTNAPMFEYHPMLYSVGNFGRSEVASDTMYDSGISQWSSTAIDLYGTYTGRGETLDQDQFTSAIYSYGYTDCSFTVDSASTITLSENHSLATGYGTYQLFGYLYLDGVYHSVTPSNTSVMVNLGPGNHFAFFQGGIYAQGNPYSSSMATLDVTFNMSITSVPEPASMVALGLGGATLLRRRKKV